MTRPLRFASLLFAAALLAGCPAPKGDDDDDGYGTTVSGFVRTVLGGPAAGVSVSVDGIQATTDGAGAFTVSGVVSPYDLAVHDPLSEQVVVVIGGYRPDPIVLVDRGAGAHEGSIDVTLSPASGGIEAGAYSLAGFVSYYGTPDPDSFQVTASWDGAPSRTGKLFAARVTATNGLIADVVSLGSADVVLQDNQTQPVTVNMTGFANEGTLVATVTTGAGYQLASVAATAVLDQTAISVLHLGQAASSPVTFVTLDTAVYETRVSALAFSAGAGYESGFGAEQRTIGPATTSVTLAPPARLNLTAPGIGGTFGAGSVVSWDPSLTGGASYRVLAAPADGTGPVFTFWVGSATTVTVPDLSAIGAAVPAESYRVWVDGIAPGPAPNDVLAGLGYLSEGQRDFVQAMSELRTVQGN